MSHLSGKKTKSAYELQREENIRRNEELLRRLGINMREKRKPLPVVQESSDSGSESDQDWKPEEVKTTTTTTTTITTTTKFEPPLKQVAYTPKEVKNVVKEFEREEKEKRKGMKRKSIFPNKPIPKKQIEVVTTHKYTFGKAKQKSKDFESKIEKDCFEDLKYVEFSSDEENTATNSKISYEDYLNKREDAELMEDEIALVSRFIRQQKLDEKLELQDNGKSKDERNMRHLKPVDYTEENLVTEDCYIFCEECDELHLGDCPAFGELCPLDESDMRITSLSPIPIPKQLILKRSSIPKAGLGIFATETIAIRTRMGSYDGVLVRGCVDNLPE